MIHNLEFERLSLEYSCSKVASKHLLLAIPVRLSILLNSVNRQFDSSDLETSIQSFSVCLSWCQYHSINLAEVYWV